jgi:hypothetical protein
VWRGRVYHVKGCGLRVSPGCCTGCGGCAWSSVRDGQGGHVLRLSGRKVWRVQRCCLACNCRGSRLSAVPPRSTGAHHRRPLGRRLGGGPRHQGHDHADVTQRDDTTFVARGNRPATTQEPPSPAAETTDPRAATGSRLLSWIGTAPRRDRGLLSHAGQWCEPGGGRRRRFQPVDAATG